MGSEQSITAVPFPLFSTFPEVKHSPVSLYSPLWTTKEKQWDVTGGRQKPPNPGRGERCRLRDGPRFGEGAEEQELDHPAAPQELLGRFPEPRLTSTGQLDHNSPALLLGTRDTGKLLLPNGAKRNRALSPPKPTRCYQSSGHLWDLGPPASCPSRDGSVRELPAQDTGAPRLVFPLPSSQYIQGFFQCISPTSAFRSSRN